jgi:Tfp pilus assembly protein FimT
VDLKVAGDRGFSIVELNIVLLLTSLVAGFAVLNSIGITPRLNANSALTQVVGEVRRGRDAALAQRRNIEMRFIGTNQIQFIRQEVPNGTTVIANNQLDHKLQFCLINGIPDTPDTFGRNAAVDFGGVAPLMFMSDGTLADGQGNPVSGTIFIGLAGEPDTARAVTILGATGRIRGYRWTGTSWIP